MDHDSRVAEAGCIRIRFPSPRRIVTRWFSPHGNAKGMKKSAMAKARVRDCNAVDNANLSDDDHGVVGLSNPPSPKIDSATSRDELHKILQLRNELEKLLEHKNNELRRTKLEFVELRNNIEKLLAYHNDETKRRQQTYSTISDVVDGPEPSATDHYYYSPQLLDTVGREGSLKHYVFKGDEVEMDQLEAELQAEFEILNIGQDHECSKVKSEESSQGARFRHVCFGQGHEQRGVCPYELERRLHEVMEERQEEEIRELEIALEDAKGRLHVKEAEASWWRDTAYVVSEHVPEPSRINNSRTHLYPLSR